MKAAAVVYVRHLDRMRAFYEACFGLKVTDGAEDHCVLESAAWTVSLVAIPAPLLPTADADGPPTRREQNPVKLAFVVAGIRELRPLVAAMGGTVDPDDTEWTSRGLRHCDGTDVEGNVVQLLEALADS